MLSEKKQILCLERQYDIYINLKIKKQNYFMNIYVYSVKIIKAKIVLKLFLFLQLCFLNSLLSLEFNFCLNISFSNSLAKV